MLEKIVKFTIEKYKCEKLNCEIEEVSYDREFIEYFKEHIPYAINKDYLKIIDESIKEIKEEERNYSEWRNSNPQEYDEYMPLLNRDKYYSYETIQKEIIDNSFMMAIDLDYEKIKSYHSDKIEKNGDLVCAILDSYFKEEISLDEVRKYLENITYKLL